ncbi:malto-oligosyltrehalose trehalohydrolase [Edaphobacter acidisoli]|uniref:Malto-oligosyltrehalose trehalohydrolase n=1 Tax=Edaphobacter acidisoli TaxID=2040573 RepID=A0A916RQB8_9BACT|nr:malto-oligosyltrehalose trehalohydrolase [Edaphobacter acidisoli]GGA64668.1 malto-oligosyltrehalose trehalohydrolase [Edaphobacter acidisoli]
MHEFALWSPYAKSLAVQVDGALYPMSRKGERGWWSVYVDSAASGTDYAFLFDDDPKTYPDPRSAWQPFGVHGPSRIYDHSAFRWTDSRWQAPPLASAVIYELHVGTFTPEGTFSAAIAHLDYLVELGVTHLELMPVAEFPGRFGWGYDGASLFAVAQKYGGPDGLKHFVDACHSRGLAVLLDVVYNHFGPVGSYAMRFGPYLTSRHHTPWGDAVNFEDAGSDEVRRFFIDNAKMWLRDFHIDGLRLDAIHEFMDRSAVHFMEQLSAEIEVLSSTLGRGLILIAESDLNDPRTVTPREAGGHGMDAQWSDDFHHALHTVLNDRDRSGYYADFGTLTALAKALTGVFVNDGRYSQYRGRSHGRPVEGLSAHHFVSFAQNHDQVGNRALGDRLESAVGMERARIAAGIVMMAPAIPMIFQGEEFAASTPFLYFADHEDVQMAKAVSEGRRREFAAFGWDPQVIPDPGSAETFECSKLRWDEIDEGAHREMLDWYRQLIHLRRNSVALNDGDLGHIKVRFDERQRYLILDRGAVKVFVNLGQSRADFAVDEGAALVLASRANVEATLGKVVLPPDTLAIFSLDDSSIM